MDVLVILLLNLCCMAASLPAATSLNQSLWNPHSHSHHHEDHMPGGFTWLHRRSDSERMVEEADFNFSSMEAHEKRDLRALLSFRNGITSDPLGKLSNWTAEKSESICSWYGIRCRPHTRRIVTIDLHASEDYEGRLKGEIPASIGSMRQLRLLNLSWNHLEGKIPASLSEISTLEQLDLAKNNLSGPIPEVLSQLHELAVLDISSNFLCGRIPTGTQFSTFNATSFQMNKCLWGCPLDTCNENERQVRKGDNASQSSNVKVGWLSHVHENMSLTALGMGMGIGFGVVVGVFMYWERAKNWVFPPNMPRPFYGVYRLPV